MKIIQSTLALVAMLFGLVTIFVGSSVLLGAAPGYIIFLPLLIYNTLMGLAYVSAGIIAFRNSKQGMYAASAIFSLNLIVLAIIYFLYREGGLIAVDSLRAMSLRTVVWFVLFVGFVWLNHKSKLSGFKKNT